MSLFPSPNPGADLGEFWYARVQSRGRNSAQFSEPDLRWLPENKYWLDGGRPAGRRSLKAPAYAEEAPSPRRCPVCCGAEPPAAPSPPPSPPPPRRRRPRPRRRRRRRRRRPTTSSAGCERQPLGHELGGGRRARPRRDRGRRQAWRPSLLLLRRRGSSAAPWRSAPRCRRRRRDAAERRRRPRRRRHLARRRRCRAVRPSRARAVPATFSRRLCAIRWRDRAISCTARRGTGHANERQCSASAPVTRNPTDSPTARATCRPPRGPTRSSAAAARRALDGVSGAGIAQQHRCRGCSQSVETRMSWKKRPRAQAWKWSTSLRM